MCNNDDIFTVFYLSAVFQFINSNKRGGLPTFRVDCCLPYLSIGVILVPLELLLCDISGGPSASALAQSGYFIDYQGFVKKSLICARF